MTGLVQDLRFAGRGLFRAPGFAAVAILTLALGIGANTAIFSFINALLLRDLPVQAPEKLSWLGVEYERGGWSNTLGYRYYELLRDESEAFSGVAAESTASVAVTVLDVSEQSMASLVTGDYFRVLGVQSAHGRLLGPDDDQPGAQPVVVLSHRYWLSRFAADPAVVGSTLRIAGRPYRVAGVAVPGFHGTSLRFPDTMWVPMIHTPAIRGEAFDYFGLDATWLQIFGRRAPGIAPASAAAEAASIYARFGEEYLASYRGDKTPALRKRYLQPEIGLEPVKAVSPRALADYRSTLGMLAGAVGFLLLITCANVANLLLARALRRQREFALRGAMGASRVRLVRQLLVEAALLAVAGGTAGIAIAWNAATLMLPLMGDRMALDLKPDGSVLAFTLATCTVSVFLFALAPALTASRVSLAPKLQSAAALGGEGRGFGSRGWFVAAQFALSLPILVAGGLFIRSAHNLATDDVGFDRTERVQATLDLGAIGYDAERAQPVFEDLLGRISAQPGVEFAALGSHGALSRAGSHRTLYVGEDRSKRVPIAMADVTVGYFKTLGIALLSGRDVRRSDDASAPPVVVISQSLATQLYGAENPLGRSVSLSRDGAQTVEVVGVVSDVKYNDIRDPMKPVAYFPFRQRKMRRANVYLRTPIGAEAVGALVREQVRAIEPLLPVTAVRTLGDQVGVQMREEVMKTTLLTAFGVLALLLTAIGLYGVVAFDVGTRIREVGLRLALGARRADVLSLVFRRAAPWVLGGAGVGLALAAVLTRYLEASLFELSPLDLPTFAGAGLFLLATAGVANYLPARRAAGTDPMTALRHE